MLIAFNVAMLVLNLVVAWKTYGYEPARPTLLEALTGPPAAPQLIDYKDFISIMLSGLSLMITVLGIGLATIAIWGYGAIKDEARQAAEKIAVREAKVVAAATARDVAQATATRTIQPEAPPPSDDGERINRLLHALMFEDKPSNENPPVPSDR